MQINLKQRQSLDEALSSSLISIERKGESVYVDERFQNQKPSAADYLKLDGLQALERNRETIRVDERYSLKAMELPKDYRGQDAIRALERTLASGKYLDQSIPHYDPSLTPKLPDYVAAWLNPRKYS